MMGLGETTLWEQEARPGAIWPHVFPADVYIWRATVTGAPIEDPRDAQLLQGAVAKVLAQHRFGPSTLELDTRAILLARNPDGPGLTVDVVATTDSGQMYVWPPKALEDVGRAVMADPSLRQRYPKLHIPAASWRKLIGPPASIDYWLQHDVIWDDAIGPQAGWSKLRGIYSGTADDGPEAPELGLAPPLLPAPPPPTDPKPSGPRWAMWGWAAAGVALAWFGATTISKELR